MNVSATAPDDGLAVLNVIDADPLPLRCGSVSLTPNPALPTNEMIASAPSKLPEKLTVTEPALMSPLVRALEYADPFQLLPVERSFCVQPVGKVGTQACPVKIIARSPANVPAGHATV